MIESISRAGKLTGNGNGMQYFGAILIRSDLSLEELDAYYSRYRSNEWECLVTLYILGEVKILYWMNWIYVDTKNEMETNYEENF